MALVLTPGLHQKAYEITQNVGVNPRLLQHLPLKTQGLGRRTRSIDRGPDPQRQLLEPFQPQLQPKLRHHNHGLRRQILHRYVRPSRHLIRLGTYPPNSVTHLRLLLDHRIQILTHPRHLPLRHKTVYRLLPSAQHLKADQHDSG